MKIDPNYPEVAVALVDDDSDIDVHIVGEGMYSPDEETADISAEFIDLDSDGEIDAVLINVGEEETVESFDSADNVLPEPETFFADDGTIDSDMQDDLGEADLNLV